MGNNFEKTVPVIISIRENKTGEVVSFESTETITNNGFDKYQWTEGNFGCDCNREMFFKERKADKFFSHEKEFDIKNCSEGKYFVNIVNKNTNEAYLQEFPITEDQKIAEYVYKELFKSLFESIPGINLDIMLLKGQIKPNVFMFRNVSAYEGVACKMTVQFEMMKVKGRS